MTLEEAEKRLTPEHSTMINAVGENEILVKKYFSDATGKPYLAYYATKPKEPIAFNGGFLGECAGLDEVKNRFISLSFASEIDPNGWGISPEKG
jgi:hypothetical protein